MSVPLLDLRHFWPRGEVRGLMGGSMKARDDDLAAKLAGAGKAGINADLFELLREDHDRIRRYFQVISDPEDARSADRKELFLRLEEELLLHMEAEERFFYTALERRDELRQRVLENYEEHQVAKLLIGAFTSLASDDARWRAKLTVLRRLIDRHMNEEELELFAIAKEVLSPEQVQGIAVKVQELKSEPKKPDTTHEAG